MKIKNKFLSLALAGLILFNTGQVVFASEQYTVTSSTASANVEYFNSSSYSVTIPSSINTGDLSPSEENIIDYSLSVENYDPDLGQVVVSSNSSANLEHTKENNEKLTITNNFDTAIIIENTEVYGNISIDPNDVRVALQGDYSGTISFTLEYQYFGNEGLTTPTPVPTTTPMPTVVPTATPTPTVKPTATPTPTVKPTATPTIAPTSSPEALDDLPDGTYTADVSMLQYYNTSQYSMCDVLFYNTADIVVSGDNAELTLYVIDPIPNFSSYGTPISDVWFEYEGKEYTATVSGTSETKYFDADGSIISENGNYSVSKLTVTVPKQAILDACDTALVCSPYVDAVMMSRQQFYVILDVDGVTNSGSSSGSSGTTDTEDEVYTDGQLNDLSVNGTYTSQADFKKEADFESFSMCDTLFYSYSDIVVVDGMATVTLYIIDPIPGYESYGTPITQVSFTYDGVTYNASIDTADQEEKYFPADDRFIFTSDDYYTSKVTVTVPVEAIETSQNATLKCTGFVNAVMNSYQTFYVVFSDTTWVSDSTDGSLQADTEDNSSEDLDENDEENGTVSDSENENSEINSVTIYGKTVFIWVLLAITIISVVTLTGYFIYKRRTT
ncbi:MAG: PT domain-containing protein [Clostridia bacterium]